ncbi:MAG: hypothetical protein ACXWWG_00575 [Nitrospira sp.]
MPIKLHSRIATATPRAAVPALPVPAIIRASNVDVTKDAQEDAFTAFH